MMLSDIQDLGAVSSWNLSVLMRLGFLPTLTLFQLYRDGVIEMIMTFGKFNSTY